MKTWTPQFSGDAQFVKRIALVLAVGVTCVFALALLSPGPIQKSSYMGAEYCGSCHQEEYRSWLSSPHARAHDVLSGDDKTNLKCLSCHATGVSDGGQPFFKGVSCEACHGPGQYYSNVHVKKDASLSKLMMMQKPDEATCMQCHSNAANLWSPHVAMKKIDHFTADFHKKSLSNNSN